MTTALLIGREQTCAALAKGLGDLGIAAVCISDDGSRAVVTGRATTVGGVDLVVTPLAASLDSEPSDLFELDVGQWESTCEIPLRRARIALQAAHAVLRERGGRMLFIVPTFAMSGAAGRVADGAAAEGIRALGKSAASAWAAEGITVNFIAVSAATLGDEALLRREVAPLIELLARSGPLVTASTLVADGGTLMAP